MTTPGPAGVICATRVEADGRASIDFSGGSTAPASGVICAICGDGDSCFRRRGSGDTGGDALATCGGVVSDEVPSVIGAVSAERHNSHPAPSAIPVAANPPTSPQEARERRGLRKSNRAEFASNRVRTSVSCARFSSSTFRKASRIVLIGWNYSFLRNLCSSSFECNWSFSRCERYPHS